MVKNVTVNAVLTPEANLDLADSMMGKVIQPQPRWSPGSLANSILSTSEVPLVLLITATAMVAVDVSNGDVPDTTSVFDELLLEGELFTADNSSTKAKTISNSFVNLPDLDLNVNIDAKFGELHPIYQILKPELPTFTLLSLVNAIETAMLDNNEFYFIVVDQRNTSVTVARFVTDAAANAALTASLADDNLFFGGDGEVVAAFSMTYDVSNPGTPSYGWE